MGTRTEHGPGTFSWVDLTTSNAAGAKNSFLVTDLKGK